MSHDHTDPPADIELRVKALESLLTEKGLIEPAALDELVDTYENRVGPRKGARVVAKAWTDPSYKARLEWVDCFSQEIKAAPASRQENANDAYYRQWLTALEKMLASRSLVGAGNIVARTEEWRAAYLNTPHGQPILLANSRYPPQDDHDHAPPPRAPVAVSTAQTN